MRAQSLSVLLLSGVAFRSVTGQQNFNSSITPLPSSHTNLTSINPTTDLSVTSTPDGVPSSSSINKSTTYELPHTSAITGNNTLTLDIPSDGLTTMLPHTRSGDASSIDTSITETSALTLGSQSSTGPMTTSIASSNISVSASTSELGSLLSESSINITSTGHSTFLPTADLSNTTALLPSNTSNLPVPAWQTLSLSSSSLISTSGSTSSRIDSSSFTVDTVEPPVTSTLTSRPPDISIETLTSTPTSFSGWVTRTRPDGIPTLYPVVDACPNCHPLVIEPPENFSWSTGIRYQWPKFPTFHFRCIKILGLAIGDCSSGPVIDDPVSSSTPTPTLPVESTSTPMPTSTNIIESSTASTPTSTATSTEVIVPSPSSTEGLQPEPEGEGCISDDIGLCSNGNYPVWDPATATISCDVSWDDVDDSMSDCQRVAESQFNLSMQAIQCDESSCSANTRRGLEKRAGTKRKKSSSNPSWANVVGGSCNKKQKPNPPFSLDPQPGKCDATFNCDTGRWPNVCNNARSAIEKRQYNSVLTYRGKEKHLTGPWSKTHGLRPDNKLTKSRYYNYGGPAGRKYVFMGSAQKKDKLGNVIPEQKGALVNVPPGRSFETPTEPGDGWGLMGCEVEEYPFGNSQADDKVIWSDKDFENGKVFPVLRLIPGAENQDHGHVLGDFIRDVKSALKQQRGTQPTEFTYCVDITGPQKNRDDYCLEPGDDDYCYNACAVPYGADFTLVNYWRDPKSDEIHYDPWFDENKKTFKHTTKSIKGKEPETTNLPSQYGKYPSPGHKTYVGDMAARPLTGTWQLSNLESAFTVEPWFAPALPVVVGSPSPRKDDDKNNGANLIYDNYPGYPDDVDSDDDGDDAMDTSAKKKRYVAQVETGWSGFSPVTNITTHDTARLSRRSIRSGSWLDPRVYSEILKCSEDSDPDYDEEEDLDIQDEWLVDEDSSSSKSETSSMSTTVNSSPTTTTTNSSSTLTSESFVTTTTASSTESTTTFIESLTASSCYPSTEPTSTDGAKEIEFSAANAAINKFCATLLETSAIIGPETHAPAIDPYFPEMTGKNFNGEPIFLHAIWNGTGSSCKPLDFGHGSESAMETCRLNLMHTYMNCFSVSDGLEYTSGGMLLANCIEWGIRPADYASVDL